MEKIHFILSPGSVELYTHGDEINGIRIWAHCNSNKRIILWYDSLADFAKKYLDERSRNLYENFNQRSIHTEHEILSYIDGEFMTEYIQYFGGAAQFRDHLTNFEHFFDKAMQPEVNIGQDITAEEIRGFIFQLEQRLHNETGGREMTEEAFRNRAVGRLAPDLESYAERKSASINHYIINNLPQRGGSIEVRDVFTDFQELYRHKLYPLYLFEIFYNRNKVIARNLLTYILASGLKTDIVITPEALPKLNENWFMLTPENDIAFNENLEFAAVPLAMKNMHAEKIVHMPFSAENTPRVTNDVPQLERVIQGISSRDIFSPVRNMNNSSMYASSNEFDSSIQYFRFPGKMEDSDINFFIDKIYETRHRQILPSFFKAFESFVGTLLKDYFQLTPNRIQKAITEIFDDFKNKFLTEGYVKYLASKYSNYTKSISEATGLDLWSDTTRRVELLKVDFISETMTVPEFYTRREQALVSLINHERVTNRSDFELDIHIYIHQRDTPYLGYVRYPHKSQKSMMFTYEPDVDENRIVFKESGIVVPETSGNPGWFHVLKETDVVQYIEQVAAMGEKVRIHIYGHSHSYREVEMIFNPNRKPGDAWPVEQTIGGLRVDQFNEQFFKWHKTYMNKVPVEKVAFVACHLARFTEETDVQKLKYLPEKSFLEEFLNYISTRAIDIKVVTASDAKVAVPPETGRLFRLLDPELQRQRRVLYRGDPGDVRKIQINSNRPIEINGKLRYRFKVIKFGTNVTSPRRPFQTLRASANVFGAVDPIKNPEVLEAPSQASNISNALAKITQANRSDHCIVRSDAMALVVGTREHAGNIVVIDTVLEKIEAVRLSLRMAAVFNDFALWKTFLKSYFPVAHTQVESLLTRENFSSLVKNVSSRKFVFMNSDLVERNEFALIKNYLEVEEFRSDVAFIYLLNHEIDVSRHVVMQDLNNPSPSDENAFALEKELILERRNSALRSSQENIKSLMQETTVLLRVNSEGQMSSIDRSHVDSNWLIPSAMPLELVSREVSHAEMFIESYHMARDFLQAFNRIMVEYSGRITPSHIPLFDTLEVIDDNVGSSSERYWNLSFVDSSNPKLPVITVRTHDSVFERVKNYVKYSAINHLNTVVSSALNLIFGVKALCHWIEFGFKAETKDTSDKTLATAIEVHFYVNAVGLMQGLAETGFLIGSSAINLLKSVVNLSLGLSSKMGYRVLLSLGRQVSRTLPIIGFFVNAADLGLNLFQLFRDDDPYQRPLLITNTIFSAAGLLVSTGAVIAQILGASMLAGSLGFIGVGIALIYIPVSYFVGKCVERIEKAKHIGLIIGEIVEEIQHGAYKRVNTLLEAPNFMAVNELWLEASDLKVRFGNANYLPSESTERNRFTHWYHPREEYGDTHDANNALVKIDSTVRSLVMPTIPNFTYEIIREVVPFSAERKDSKFKPAEDLQEKDPGFDFQDSRGIWPDAIAVEDHFKYENTQVTINIKEENWTFIFPWSDTQHARKESEEKEKQAQQFNDGIKNRLGKICYTITAEKFGRQTISLPPMECPVTLQLGSNNASSWFLRISSDERIFDVPPVGSLSDKIKVENGTVKIGEKQKIEFNEVGSDIYLVLPKYFYRVSGGSMASVTAYFEVKKNRCVYTDNRQVSEEDQKDASLIFCSDRYAYFCRSHQSQGADPRDITVWCIDIETKRVEWQEPKIKDVQKQGAGLLLVHADGYICHSSENTHNRGTTYQVIGFTEDWFNQKMNTLKALEDVDTVLKERCFTPIIRFHLPYFINERKLPEGCVLYHPKRGNYFLVDADHALHAQFLKLDRSDLVGYFYHAKQKIIIVVNAVDRKKALNMLQMHDDKVQVRSVEANKTFLKGVKEVGLTQTGMKMRLSCGLVALLNEETNENRPTGHLNVEKLVLTPEDFSGQPEQRVQEVLQKSLHSLEKDMEDNGFKLQITYPAFLAIEYDKQNTGFYETSTNRVLSKARLPKTDGNVTPLGTDGAYAYDILNGKAFYRTRWVSFLSELKVTPETQGTEAELVFEAEVFALYDQTVFIKDEVIGDNFCSTIFILAKLPEINLICIEANAYELNLGILKNVALSSMDLSEPALRTNINLKIEGVEGHYFVRENSSLCLHHPGRNFSFFFRGVFKNNTLNPGAEGVAIFTDRSEPASNLRFSIVTLVNQYAQKQVSFDIDGKNVYSRIPLKDFAMNSNETEVPSASDVKPTSSSDRIEDILRSSTWRD